MKKIVLLGDSIRMGYDKYIKDALDGIAEVYYPPVNCRYVAYLLRFVHEWKSQGDWPTDIDLVHWNAGLWDVLELYGDVPLTSKDYYLQAIKRIDKRLRMLFPKAKIVFATSTAVLEEKYEAKVRRSNTTIDEYNQIAVEALKDTDTVIHDLFKYTFNCPPEYHSDMTHFNNDKGRVFMGEKVLAFLCRELDISSSEVNIDNFKPENYTDENIGY